MSRSFQGILLVTFVALVLFVVGPQLGSIDADEDGYPEVSVVVANSGPSLGAARSELRTQSLQETHQPPPSQAAIRQNAAQVEKPAVAYQPGRSLLRSACLLRC